MSNSNEKYIGESLIREEPGKKLKLKIGDKVIKKKHLSDEVYELFNDVDDLQNQIDSLEVAGIALSNNYGNDPYIGISQKKLTESYNEQAEKNAQYDETLDEHTTELDNTYRKSETYSREQIDNMYTTPDQHYESYSAEDGDELSDILPAAGEAHTIYRVGNWDGTGYDEGGYTEYAWDGTQYVQLSVKEPGIDEVPTKDSNNLVKSNGIYDILHDKVDVELEDLTAADYHPAVQQASGYVRGYFYFPVEGDKVSFSFQRATDNTTVNYQVIVRTSPEYNQGDILYTSNWINDTLQHSATVKNISQQCYLHFCCMYAEGDGYPTFAEVIAGLDSFEVIPDYGSPIYKGLNAIEEIVDLEIVENISFDSSGFVSGYRWIDDEGSFDPASSTNGEILSIPVAKGYKTVSATLGCTGVRYLAIAFYSEEEISSEYFISGVHTKNSSSYQVTADVPENAKLIVVENRPATLATPSVEIECFSSKSMVEIEALREGLSNPVPRNSESIPRVVSASRNGRDFQMCLVSDPHNDKGRVRNAAEITDGFSTVDIMLGLGDFVSDNMQNRSNADYVFEKTADMTKPFLLVLGNHDVGNTTWLPYTIDHEESYNIWMQPLHDKGLLTSNENPDGTCYWYKDFATKKIRLIGLNCYDEDIQLDETYWEPITYDESIPLINTRQSYAVGSTVNCLNYTKYSFRAVQAVDVDSSGGIPVAKRPGYKCKRGTFVIRETQANWFAGKLASTPEGYGVVVALHGAFSSKCYNQSAMEFGGEDVWNEDAIPGSHYMMETDMLAEMVNAYMKRERYHTKVRMTANSSASYMNTEGVEGDKYAYELDVDFSNATGNFMCWLGGHWHKDIIWRHRLFNEQYQVAVVYTNQEDWEIKSSNKSRNDVVASTEKNVANDYLTTVAVDVDNRKLRLARIGQDTTIFGKRRELQTIPLSTDDANSIGNTEYYGKPISLKLNKEKHYCSINQIHAEYWTDVEGSVDPLTITVNNLADTQSTAVYKWIETVEEVVDNNTVTTYVEHSYIFNFIEINNQCLVMDLQTKEILGLYTVTGLTGWHFNNAQFSNIFYDDNDEFPLLLLSDGNYLSEGNNAKCAYVRIGKSGNTFTFTKIKEIQCTFDKGIYIGTFVADWETNRIWMYCFDHVASGASNEYNPIWISEYELPDYSDAETTVLTEDMLLKRARITMYRPVLQGAATCNGKILIGCRSVKPTEGLTHAQDNESHADYVNGSKMLLVLDQGSLAVESYIPLPAAAYSPDTTLAETEGVSICDGKLYISERRGGRTQAQHDSYKTKQIYLLYECTF